MPKKGNAKDKFTPIDSLELFRSLFMSLCARASASHTAARLAVVCDF